MWERDHKNRKPSRNHREDPWANKTEQERRVIFGGSQSLRSVLTTISPNSSATTVAGFPNPLSNNHTISLPSSSPDEWAQSGDAVWCHFSPAPLIKVWNGTSNLPFAITDELTILPITKFLILNMGGLHLKVTNSLGDTDGQRIRSGIWPEFIVTDWVPGTLTWNSRPLSFDSATSDAAGTTPWLGAALEDFYGLNGVFGPGQVVSTAADAGQEPQAEEMRREVKPGQTSLITSGFAGPASCTTTSIFVQQWPIGYANPGVDLTTKQFIYNSQYNVDGNFIGSYVAVTPWPGDSSRSVVYSKVTGYDSTTGRFTILPTLPWAPQVGTSGGVPDNTKTDSIVIYHPFYGIALHMFAKAIPEDAGHDPKTFSAVFDAPTSLTWEIESHKTSTGALA